MNILITGGAGYIGLQLLQALPEELDGQIGYIRLLDNMQEEKYQALMNLPAGVDFQFVLGDIRDPDAVSEALAGGVDTVIHLAALTNATLSFEREKETWETNYQGTLNLIRAVREAPSVRRFIYASTCSVYGPANGEVREDSPCRPASPYGEYKLKGESDVLALLKATSGRVRPTALRFATVYGNSPGLRVHTVLNIFTFRAAVGAPIEVYVGAGQQDGEQKRPYIHVSDVARAIAFCLTEPRTHDELFNVVGQNASVNEILALMQPQFLRLNVTYTEKEILNQFSYTVDGSKLASLGFRARKTLGDGIEEFARLYDAFTRIHVG